jgi:hypothetical protein
VSMFVPTAAEGSEAWLSRHEMEEEEEDLLQEQEAEAELPLAGAKVARRNRAAAVLLDGGAVLVDANSPAVVASLVEAPRRRRARESMILTILRQICSFCTCAS